MRVARVLVALALFTGCAAASHETANSVSMYPPGSPCKNYLLLGEDSDYLNFPGLCMRTHINLIMNVEKKKGSEKAAKWRCKNVYGGTWFRQTGTNDRPSVPQCNRVRHGNIGHP